jgi:hypothetical protein
LDFQRAVLWLGWAFCALACGEKFTGVESGTAGTAGKSTSHGGDVSASGSAAGGEGAADGGTQTGGKATVGGGGRGGSGGAGAGQGGTAGVAALGGTGGVVVVEPPIPVDGLELWFDATVGVTESNGVVTTWKDRSKYARHALQTAVNYRPKLVVDGFNGKPTVVFDGEDRYLKVPTLPGDFTRGVSIFTVGEQITDDGGCTGMFEASNGPEIDDVHLGTWESALLYEVYSATMQAKDEPLLLGEPQLLAAVHQMNGAVQLRRNSSGLGEANMELPVTIPREQVYLGRTAYANCVPYHGTLSEVLVYSRGVSDAELIQIEAYLQNKWDCCAD